MLYVIANYWSFLLAALLIGVVVGWWAEDPRRADDLAAWLEHGPDER